MVRQRDELKFGGKSNTIVQALLKTTVKWADLFERVTVKAGQDLIVAGIRNSYIYFPIDAVVSELVSPDGPKDAPLTVNILGSADVVGADALLDNAPSGSTATVDVGGAAIRANAQAVRLFMQESKDGRELLQAYLVLLRIESMQWLSFSLQRGATERVAAYLFRMWQLFGDDRMPISHYSISKRLNVRRASIVEKVIPELTELGFVSQFDKGRIDVTDGDAFTAYMRKTWPLYGTHRQAFLDALTIS